MSDWRKVWAWTDGPYRAVVQRSAEWQEFRVRLYTPGGPQAGADHHTSDRTEAMSTAKVMVRRAKERAAA